MDWQGIFYDGWEGIVRAAIAALCAYAALILILRISGKRSLSKLNIFDFVVTVALGSTLASTILSKDVALAEGTMALAALVGLQFIVAQLSIMAEPWKKIIRSDPKIVVKDGEFVEDCMKQERVTRGSVESEIRKSGYGDVSKVAYVILESDGTFSVIGSDKLGDGTALRTVPNVEGSGA